MSQFRLKQAIGRLTGRVPVTLLVIVVASFALGGGSRADILSLVVLRPVSVLLLAVVSLRYGSDAWSRQRFLLLLALCATALAVAHVLPLPPALWSRLPSRELVVASYRDLHAPLPWLPLTLAPAMAWNALFSLACPLAAMIVAACVSQQGHRRLVAIFVALALISGVLGLLQVAGPPNGPLFFYRVTNQGAAVGLFANRNHNALFISMAIPMLALFWNDPGELGRRRIRRAILAVLAALLALMVLLTGSRGGMLMGGIAALAAVGIARRGRPDPETPDPLRHRGKRAPSPAALAVGLALSGAVIALLAIVVIHSAAFARLAATDPAQEMRLNALPIIWAEVGKYWPLGSGAGSFEFVYRNDEPLALVGPQYLNHAHDDWLELVLTYGLAGLLLLLAGAASYLVGVARLVRLQSEGKIGFNTALGWAGAAIVLITGLLSAFDYPLRVPAIQVVTVIAAIWLARAGERAAGPRSASSSSPR